MQEPYQALVDRLKLEPHPEGGFYRETYRCSEVVNGAHAYGGRSASTAILFLLPLGHVSALHRIKSDELWHFYAGSPLRVVELTADGTRIDHRLGGVLDGHVCQAVVRAGSWFGAFVDASSGWSLVGCTVAPGFEFADLEMAERGALTEQYPAHAAIVEQLTR
jgi:predicted cupin superfamily sugar epimerase